MSDDYLEGLSQSQTHRLDYPIAAVTREEYDALFLCCVRLTDRIEALEKAMKPLGFMPRSNGAKAGEENVNEQSGALRR